MSKSPAEEFEQIYFAVSDTNESFNQKFSLEELIQIHRMRLASEYDFCPDQWSERQVKEALEGIVPSWDDNEKPVYFKRKVKKISSKIQKTNFTLNKRVVDLFSLAKKEADKVALDSQLEEAAKFLVRTAVIGEPRCVQSRRARDSALAVVIAILINMIEERD